MQVGQRLAPPTYSAARLPSPARLAILLRSPLSRWMLAELIAILAGLAAIAAYLLGRRAGRQEDPWVLVEDTPAATPTDPDIPLAVQTIPSREGQVYRLTQTSVAEEVDSCSASAWVPRSVAVGRLSSPAAPEVPTAAPAAPEVPVAARTVHWRIVGKDPVRALRNWTRLARTARRIRRLRIILSGLGNHLKQFSHLR